MPKLVIGAQLVVTAGINIASRENDDFNTFVSRSLGRFTRKDWGEIDEEDRKMNDAAVSTDDDRIVAKYEHEAGNIFIITESDSSVTTVLFCDEY